MLDLRPQHSISGDSDGGAILLRAADQGLGLTSALAHALEDERQSKKIKHELGELLTQRVMAIACGYPDTNDAARRPCRALKITGDSKQLFRVSEALADCVIERHRRRLQGRARRITIDLDPTDDPTHGAQQLTFFNHHYDTYCYLPVGSHRDSTAGLAVPSPIVDRRGPERAQWCGFSGRQTTGGRLRGHSTAGLASTPPLATG